MDFMDDVVKLEFEQIRPLIKTAVTRFRLGADGVFKEIPEDVHRTIVEMADKVESLKNVDEKCAYLKTLNSDQLKDLMSEFFYRDLYKMMF